MQDIIIRGGEVRPSPRLRGSISILTETSQNLFPVQIENALTAHPDVREVAAIAVPDALYGEVVGAWITPRTCGALTRAAVRAHVSAAINPQVRSARCAVLIGRVEWLT